VSAGRAARLVRRAALFLATLLALAGLAAFFPPPHGTAPAGFTADAAVVLSGDVDYLRVQRAVALYRAGQVGRLVTTGVGIGGDDAVQTKGVAVRLGVPSEAVLVEPASRTTRENLLFVAPLVRRERWRRIALVTSASHMGRAERVARRVLPEIEWLAVPVADAGPWSRICQQRALEWLKLAGYALRGWS
jgi:uncharacterized SAM-binding protein YcdF (DUF218 family)